MAQAQESVGQQAGATEAEASLLDKIIEGSRVAKTDNERVRAKDLISEFVEQVLGDDAAVSPDVIATIESRIAQLDELLSEQMNEILHAADFQKLEGSWRGLRHLVYNSETSTTLKIRVLSCSKKELLRDFKTVTEFDQSALFKKIYEDEYGDRKSVV